MGLIAFLLYRNHVIRKLRENELGRRELDQQTLAVVNNTDSIILSLKKDGTIRIINQAAIDFYKKWTGIELRAGRNVLNEFENVTVHNRWSEWMDKSRQSSHWKEISQLKIDGQERYFLENFSAVYRNESHYAGLVMVAADITKEHADSVEISHQKNKLEKSNQAKERMISILAHDLKDSIYSAHSLAEMIVETPESFDRDELLRLFGMLRKNFSRTRNMLDGLLEWMKTQTSGMKARTQKFNLHQIVKEVLAEQRPKSQRKKVKLEVDIDKDIYVKADPEMIKTVLRNLVSNAIKYVESGTGKVTVESRHKEGDLEIHVIDNGVGMSTADQRKLFRQPGRFSKPGTADEQGTGFGLSLCNELLRMNRCRLQVQSREGIGSDFYFSLPYAVGSGDSVEIEE